MKKLVLFVCLLNSIYGCNSKKKQTDLEKMGFKGDVLCVITKGNLVHPILEFDKYGNLIRTITFFDLDDVKKLYENIYFRDSLNKIIFEKEFIYSNQKGVIYYPLIKKYNYLKNRISSVEYEDRVYKTQEMYKYAEDFLVEIKKEFSAKLKSLENYIVDVSYFYDQNKHLDSLIEITFEVDNYIKNINIYDKKII